MSKKSKSKLAESAGQRDIGADQSHQKTTTMDPTLAALFTSSVGVALPGSNGSSKLQISPAEASVSEEGSSSDEDLDRGSTNDVSEDEEGGVEINGTEPASAVKVKPSRKRRRTEDDIEGVYLQRLAEEQERTDIRRKRSRLGGKSTPDERQGSSDRNLADGTDESQSPIGSPVPQHETLAPNQADVELEKASRTVFLGNVSTSCIKSKSSYKELLEYLGSFLSEIPESKQKHQVESLRFRSTAFASASVPKKAAFAKKELMDATTQSTNAYAVYSTGLAAREAVRRLNGTVILDRHLRVDGVAHPAKVDHRRCVFVGNLGFVDDESQIRAAQGEDENKSKKPKSASDVEEGLWRKFSESGQVESVRVVRDKTTRVGKGFAYVQFKDGNSVEKALLYNDKKFPPLLPRKLRVVRAKNIAKTTSHSSREQTRPQTHKERVFNPKVSSKTESLAGRAGKLLGRAGSAQYRKSSTNAPGLKKTPEDVVFEGHRARGNQGKGTILGKSKKKGTKPTNRSSKRGAAFKASKKGR